MSNLFGWLLEIMVLVSLAILFFGLPTGLLFLYKYRNNHRKMYALIGITLIFLFIIILGYVLFLSLKGIPIMCFENMGCKL